MLYQLEQIDVARRMIARYPDALQLALTADDVERAHERGRIASLLGIEGGDVIENRLGLLRAFHDLGARYMTLTHGSMLDWADSGTDAARHGGLTRFGISQTAHPDIDVAHLTEHAAIDLYRARYWDAARLEKLPPRVGVAVMDGCVQHRIRPSVRMLQATVGTEMDGKIGPITLATGTGRGTAGP